MNIKSWKSYKIILFVIACLMINLIGKNIAESLQLPFWLDSIGTVLAATFMGPVCGAVVGVGVNLMYGALDYHAYLYAVTNAMVGIIVGIFVQRKWLERAFSTFSISMIVAIVSTVISTPLNYFLYGGTTGNIWGDGVIHYLQENGVHDIICFLLGEFYVDLADKMLALFLAYFVVRYCRISKVNKKKSGGDKAVALVLIGVLIFGIMSDTVVAADGEGSGADNNSDEYVEEINFDSYIQTVYNSENGIPGGKVNDIEQTRDGMLWVGTYGGLYQYDGSKFSVMSEFESVRNANCLYTDEEGRLWIGTNDSGLSICSNGQIVNSINKEGGLPEDSVRSIIKSDMGVYYVGTTGSMCVVRLADGIQVVKVIDELKYVIELTANKSGDVCAVTSDGKLAILRDAEILKVYDSAAKEEKYSCVLFDGDNTLYAATVGGNVYKYKYEDGNISLLDYIECGDLIMINSLYITEDGAVMIGADNGIGCISRDGMFKKINTNNFDNSICGILVDYQGNIWFSSSRLGLLELSKSISKEIFTEAGVEEVVANAVTKWCNSYFIGTDSGLIIIDDNQEAVLNELCKVLEGVRVRSLFVDSLNSIWIATYGKGIYNVQEDGTINCFDTSTGLIDDWTRTAIELHTGEVAVATDGGISIISEGGVIRNIDASDGMDNVKVLCAYEWDNALYAGTDGGGIAVIRNDKVTGIIRRVDGLGSDIILRIKESSDGKGLFIVTSNSINYLDEEGNIRILDKFPYFNNYDIVFAEDGRLWIPSSAGIYITDEKGLLSGEDLDYEVLDSKKGFRYSYTANSWNYLDSDGELYLCIDKGVVAINTREYNHRRPSYRIILDNIIVDGKRVVVDKEEDNLIERDAVRVEFYPKIINYTLSDPYVSVWLEGFDTEASIMPQSELESVAYTNLPYGKYVFHVGILDNKQENIVEEVSYVFIKDRAIYDNWWFDIYMLLMLLIITVYFAWLIVGSQIDKSLKIQRKEFENLKLKQKADAALAAGEAKDKFLALMSHDIRTPINAILGMNEMILRDCKEDSIYEYAQDVKSASTTLLSLVNSILDYSKIEQGKMEIINVKYDTRAMLSNLINGIANGAKDKGLEFKTDIDKTLPSEMFGDDLRIAQVISNLLSNAVKYTEKGFVSLTVKEKERKGDIITLYIEVKDSGIGIKKEDLGKLFESFQRLDEVRNRNIQGTGLGMVIVDNLLTMMGSKLDVESEYEVGTKFSFLLDQKIMSDKSIGSINRSRRSASKRDDKKHIQAPRASVLIVDDNDMNLKVASRLLKINGIIPDVANSGEEAINKVKDKRYDLIFLDHMMPGMDGIQTLEAIRKDNLVPEDTRIIVLTANAINGAREQYLKAGFDDYISKPIEVDVLESRLEQYLPKSVIDEVDDNNDNK